MKAIITLTDSGGNGFEMKTLFEGPLQANQTHFNPQSPAHAAAARLIGSMDEIAERRGQPVVKNTNEVTVQETDERQQMALYEVLGKWRDQMPIAAVNEFQHILGPLPSNVVSLKDVALARPSPEEIAGN